MNVHRPSNPILWVVFVVLLIGSAPQASEAVPITFQGSGLVDPVSPGLTGTFSRGNTLSFSYTFESTTPPRAGSSAGFARFDALLSLSFSIGGYSAFSTGGIIGVFTSGFEGLPYDAYAVQSSRLTGAPVGSKALSNFDFLLVGPGTLFTTALNLPTDLSLSSFESKLFSILFVAGDGCSLYDCSFYWGVGGHLTDLRRVPTPGTLLLLGSSFAVLSALYWSCQRQR